MFIQVHILQSMPPGNLNRDEEGQPKKCVFGGVMRARISSQCLKRNIRGSSQFVDAFDSSLAVRTCYLPRLIVDAAKAANIEIPEPELKELATALSKKFKKDKKTGDAPEGSEDEATESDAPDGSWETTGQLVFFPPPFALKIAELGARFKADHKRAYERFIGRKLNPKPDKTEDNELNDSIKEFVAACAHASKELTVDIRLFGRMTTSDLVVNVEAACQVAHAISTHEPMIESDYFTAWDEKKAELAGGQSQSAGAAFLGRGETETFFNAAVYYKYLNLDLDALRGERKGGFSPPMSSEEAARAASVLVSAAALATPTGKQNAFASHSVPELILVEFSAVKRPISYANAFLQPVIADSTRNLMADSADALVRYIDSVAAAFAPADVKRVLLAVGHAKEAGIGGAEVVPTLAKLAEAVLRNANPALRDG